jgi:hypothetical protein
MSKLNIFIKILYIKGFIANFFSIEKKKSVWNCTLVLFYYYIFKNFVDLHPTIRSLLADFFIKQL